MSCSSIFTLENEDDDDVDDDDDRASDSEDVVSACDCIRGQAMY